VHICALLFLIVFLCRQFFRRKSRGQQFTVTEDCRRLVVIFLETFHLGRLNMRLLRCQSKVIFIFIVVLVAVVVAFVICWAPFHAQRLMTIYTSDDQWTDAMLETQSLLFYTSGSYDYVIIFPRLCGCYIMHAMRGWVRSYTASANAYNLVDGQNAAISPHNIFFWNSLQWN
jgi:hypothetical protein